MIEDRSVLAVIPARAGSKGIPNKNILQFAGLPLIAHTLLFAKMCPEIHRCIVSTGRVFLDSNVNDQVWELNATGTVSVTFADIEDSNAITLRADDHAPVRVDDAIVGFGIEGRAFRIGDLADGQRACHLNLPAAEF